MTQILRTALLALAVILSTLDRGYAYNNEEALRAITDAADRICGIIGQEGKSESLSASGKINAELNGLLKRLAGAGAEVSGTFDTKKYTGVLQQDLASTLKSTQECKLKVFFGLKDNIMPRDSGQDDRGDLSGIIGSWVGGVSCLNGQEFVLRIVFIRQIGKSVIGTSTWSGSNRGSDRVTLISRGGPNLRYAFSLISEKPSVYQYNVNIKDKNMEGISLGTEQCTLRIDRD